MLDNRFHSPVDDDRIAGRFVSVAAAFLIAASTVSREYIFFQIILIQQKLFFHKKDTNKKAPAKSEFRVCLKNTETLGIREVGSGN